MSDQSSSTNKKSWFSASILFSFALRSSSLAEGGATTMLGTGGAPGMDE